MRKRGEKRKENFWTMVISQRRVIRILETIWFLYISFYLVTSSIINTTVVRTLFINNVSSKELYWKSVWSLLESVWRLEHSTWEKGMKERQTHRSKPLWLKDDAHCINTGFLITNLPLHPHSCHCHGLFLNYPNNFIIFSQDSKPRQNLVLARPNSQHAPQLSRSRERGPWSLHGWGILPPEKTLTVGNLPNMERVSNAILSGDSSAHGSSLSDFQIIQCVEGLIVLIQSESFTFLLKQLPALSLCFLSSKLGWYSVQNVKSL